MLLPSRVAGRTLGLRGPDLARGPEVARLCSNERTTVAQSSHSSETKCYITRHAPTHDRESF